MDKMIGLNQSEIPEGLYNRYRMLREIPNN